MSSKNPWATFGALLSDARRAAGIAQQADLAALLGVGQQTVSRWERGLSRPRASQLPQVAAAVTYKGKVADLFAAAGYAPTSPPQATFDKPWPVDALPPDSFERFCTDFLTMLYPDADVHRYGDHGHKQDGLDVEAVFPDCRVFTFQCKRHSAFGPKKIDTAVKAHTRAADKKVILLSSVASPQAREAMKRYAADGWELWDREDISRRARSNLSKVDRQKLVDTYFRGQRLALLGELEPSPWRTPEEFFAGMLNPTAAFTHEWVLVGREGQLKELLAWVSESESPVIVVTGSGGAGKSRVLKSFVDEVAKARSERVYFLSRDRLTSKGLEELGDGPKLLICDDAHERDDLGILFDYVANPASEARLVVSLRRYGLTRLEQQARSLFLAEMPEVAIAGLTQAESETLAKEALERFGGDLQYGERLAKYTRDCPLATVIGARVLAAGKSFPEFLVGEEEFRNELMRRLVREIVDGVSNRLDPVAVRKVLGAVALMQPIKLTDREVTATLEKIGGLPHGDAAQILKRLRDSGILFDRAGKARLAPDLLGDFVIEDECIGSAGESTGFAERVFDDAPDAYAEHILVNLGRLDWAKSSGDTRQSALLAQLWGRLQWHEDYYTPHVHAAAAAAYYQPRQALAFAERMIREGHKSEEVARVIRNAAYNFDCLPEACSMLWGLGRDDERERGRHLDHGVRLLAELAAPQPNKPIVYMERVVDFALSLIPQPESWQGVHSPLDILEGALNTEGQTTKWTARAMTLTPFSVAQTPMAALRRKVIDACIDLLSHPDSSRGYKAAALLGHALRYPMRSGSADGRDLWTEEFCDTLQRLNESLDKHAVAATVLTKLAESVSWHANYCEGPTRPLAKAILERLDKELRTRTIRALVDGWGSMTRRIGEDGTLQAHEDETEKLVSDLVGAHPDGEELRSFIDSCMGDIAGAKDRSGGTPHIFMGRLLSSSEPLSRAVVEDALAHPKSATAALAGIALAKLLQGQADLARSVISRTLEVGDETAMPMVAEAYVRYQPSNGYSELDRRALRTIVRSPLPEVLWCAASASRQVAQIDADLGLELLTSANFQAAPRVAHEFMLWLCDERTIPVERLTAEHVQKVLDALFELPDLRDFWVQSFLRKALRRYPRHVIEFLKRRVERADAPHESSYQAIPSGPSRHKPTKFMDLSDATSLLIDLLEWGSDHELDGSFPCWFGDLMEFLCAPFDDRFVSCLESWVVAGDKTRFDLALGVLREGEPSLVFQHEPFTLRFLRHAQTLGNDALRDARSTLFAPSISGVRGGTIGEPFHEDVDLKDKAQTVLSRLGRFDPAYPLYEQLAKYAEKQIAVSREEGRVLEDEE